MLDRIRHRGPDGRDTWVEGHVGLGHLRLSILDLSDAAAQPMSSADGRWLVSFNGEIFNFAALSKELDGRRRSTGDTEVLVECLAQHGIEATLPRLEGDFAFAAWDRKDRTLHLVRDRHGVKPLYLAEGPDGTVRFGSEVKALAPPGDATPDVPAVQSALLGYSCTYGSRTMFRGVRSIQPGEWIRFHDSDPATSRRFATTVDWVSPERHAELTARPTDEVLALIGNSFTTSTRARMISDAPLATLVSGGVDSSLVAAVAASEDPEMIGYHADVTADSEQRAAAEVARTLDMPLRVVSATDDDILDALPAVTWHNEVPLTYHMNSAPFYLVTRVAHRDGIKVVLTGEGSDEYFLGYPALALEPVRSALESLRRSTRTALDHTIPRLAQFLWPHEATRFEARLADLVTAHEDELVDAAGAAAVDGVTNRRERRALRLTLGLVQQHLVSLLHRNDRLGMASSIESRFPFLGRELAALAVNLPASYKIRSTTRLHDRRHPFVVDKWAVRQLARRLVPAALANRAKQGFPVSLERRLRIDAAAFHGGPAADIFSLDRRSIESLVRSGPSTWATRLLLIDLWARLFAVGCPVDECRTHLRSTTSLLRT